MADIDASIPQRIPRNAIINYRIRLTGYTLWVLMLISIPEFQRDPRRWVVVGFLLVLPHLLYLRSRRASSGYHAEYVNLALEYWRLMDSGFGLRHPRF